MIDKLKESAENVGISAFITNSEDRIETQLNRLTREEDLPIMLISWDIDVSLSFDENGFMENPVAQIVALLVTKPEDTSKQEAEDNSAAMGKLFEAFLRDLHGNLIEFQKQTGSPITSASYKLVPKHGAGKHSGVLGRFSMRIDVENC